MCGECEHFDHNEFIDYMVRKRTWLVDKEMIQEKQNREKPAFVVYSDSYKYPEFVAQIPGK